MVKLISLEVYNCKRFGSNKKHFRYTPNKPIQLIVGSNGSGKSTLLEYIFPNSPNKKDFIQGGYRRLEYLIDEGTVYIENMGNKHSFILNTKELNDGGTARVQDKLIEEYFNISKREFQLMAGKVHFSGMKEADRREWILGLSDNDFTFAMQLFDKAKVRRRDLKGIMAHINTKLSAFPTKPSEVKLTSYKDALENAINEEKRLLQSKVTKHKVSTTKDYIQSFESKVQALSNNLLNRRSLDVQLLNQQLGYIRLKIDNINKEIKRVKAITDKKAEDDRVKRMVLEKNELKEEILKIKDRVDKLPTDIPTTSELARIDIDNDITLIQELSPAYGNMDVSILKDTYEELTSLVSKLRNEEHTLKHYLDKDYVTCPKCDNKFIPDSEYNKEQMTDRLKVVSEKIRNNVKSLKEVANDIEHADKITRAVERVHHQVGKLLKVNRHNITHECETIHNLLNTLIVNATLKETYDKLSMRYDNLKHTIDETMRIREQFSNVGDIVKDVDMLTSDKSDLLAQQTKVREDITYANHTTKMRDMLTDKKGELALLKKELPLLKENEAMDMINSSIDKELTEVRKTMLTLSETVSEYSNYVRDYGKLINELKDTEIRESTLKELVETLDPNKGIIGKAIHGLIDAILDELNSFISTIWNGEMLVRRSEKSVYLFEIVRSGNITDDISMGSAGMRSVVDVAFRIIAMRILEKANYMFILDEFGADLDTTHKRKAIELVNVLPNYGFEHVYVVSHFIESVYSATSMTEVTVMDAENILLDRDIEDTTIARLDAVA